MYKTENQQGPTAKHRVRYSILCNNYNGKESEKENNVLLYIYSFI